MQLFTRRWWDYCENVIIFLTILHFQVPAILFELCERCPTTGGKGFVWRGVDLEKLIRALARLVVVN